MFHMTRSEASPVGRREETDPLFSRSLAAGISMKPRPWSILPEPSPSTEGLADRIRALRISIGDAPGTSLMSSAAAPATVGAAKEVPDTRSRVPRAPCAKLPNPFATRWGLHRPSAVGPRELNDAIWCCPNGRIRIPEPTPN